ncbi:peptidoglycan-binding protein [Actinokineospora pegani]|uniref:peptidoglycan-binding protein n=1 Tax=Actinokineospora pegani TaxID=2654637 RepID=UPI0012EAA2BE|nr:peptidoglycan-binding protein [Actinokineospora pegani]
MGPDSKRKRLLLGVLGALVLVTAGGVVGARFVKSPAQVAAEQGPVAPSTLTAAVERRVVGSVLVVRGTVSGAEDVRVTPAPTATETAAKPLVSGIRKRTGDTVAAEEVVVEVAGRPLVALRGDVPAYRDMRPGATGDDIAALRAALDDLGYPSTGDPAGEFGAATKEAVRDFYDDLGFSSLTTGDDTAVKAAQQARTQAERTLRDAREAAPQPNRHAVADAAADLATARRALAEAQARSGPVVPAAEVAFLPTFPARVTASTAEVGAPVEAPLVTLSSGRLQVVAGLDPADRDQVKPGGTAEIDSEVTGFHGTGTVGAVGEQPAGDTSTAEGQQRQATATIVPDAPLDPGLIGQDVRLTLRSGATAGPVLAVPSAAVTSSADGRTHVVVVDASGAQHAVEVRAGRSGGGFVEVDPVSGALAEGDKVVVGR